MSTWVEEKPPEGFCWDTSQLTIRAAKPRAGFGFTLRTASSMYELISTARVSPDAV